MYNHKLLEQQDIKTYTNNISNLNIVLQYRLIFVSKLLVIVFLRLIYLLSLMNRRMSTALFPLETCIFERNN